MSSAVYEIQLEPRGVLPRLDAVVTTHPVIKPEPIVTPLAQAMANALERCSSTIPETQAASGPFSFDFILGDGKLQTRKAASQSEFYACFQRAIDGTALPINDITGEKIAVGILVRLSRSPAKGSTSPP